MSSIFVNPPFLTAPFATTTYFKNKNLFDLSLLSYEECFKLSGIDLNQVDLSLDYSHLYKPLIRKDKGRRLLSQEEQIEAVHQNGGIVVIRKTASEQEITSFIKNFASTKALYSSNFIVEVKEIKELLNSLIDCKPPPHEEFVPGSKGWFPNLKIFIPSDLNEANFSVFHGYSSYVPPQILTGLSRTKSDPSPTVTKSFCFI